MRTSKTFAHSMLLVSALVLATCACNQQKSAAEQQKQEPPAAGQPQAAGPVDFGPESKISGERAMQFTREVVAFGPRYVSSPGHAKVESYLKAKLKGDQLQEDKFTATTPLGNFAMTNYIAKYPGTKDGVVVIAGHYDTLYKRNDFVGANDGGSSTGLLLELANEFRGQLKNGKRNGYSVWIVWLDGEEAFEHWTDTDSTYGSRHLADKWKLDGTAAKVKAFILADMIGDSDLNLERDANSTGWLIDLVAQAASRFGYQSHFFGREAGMMDDHVPFANVGVPVIDLIDFEYGYGNAFWHTKEDTIDKLSPKSFEIVGKTIAQAVQLIDKH